MSEYLARMETVLSFCDPFAEGFFARGMSARSFFRMRDGSLSIVGSPPPSIRNFFLDASFHMSRGGHSKIRVLLLPSGKPVVLDAGRLAAAALAGLESISISASGDVSKARELFGEEVVSGDLRSPSFSSWDDLTPKELPSSLSVERAIAEIMESKSDPNLALNLVEDTFRKHSKKLLLSEDYAAAVMSARMDFWHAFPAETALSKKVVSAFPHMFHAYAFIHSSYGASVANSVFNEFFEPEAAIAQIFELSSSEFRDFFFNGSEAAFADFVNNVPERLFLDEGVRKSILRMGPREMSVFIETLPKSFFVKNPSFALEVVKAGYAESTFLSQDVLEAICSSSELLIGFVRALSRHQILQSPAFLAALGSCSDEALRNDETFLALISAVPAAYPSLCRNRPHERRRLFEYLQHPKAVLDASWNVKEVLGEFSRDERKVVIETHPFLLMHADKRELLPESWKEDPESYERLQGLFKHAAPSESVLEALADREDLCLSLVMADVESLGKLPERARTKRIILECVKSAVSTPMTRSQVKAVGEAIPPSLFSDVDFCVELISIERSFSEHMPKSLFSDYGFVQSALTELDAGRMSSMVFSKTPKAALWLRDKAPGGASALFNATLLDVALRKDEDSSPSRGKKMKV